MKYFFVCAALVASAGVQAQSSDETTIRTIYDEALARGKSYEMLEYLTTKIGSRLSGSPGAAASVEWTRHIMQNFDFDSVWLQPVMVPHWERGQKEIARVLNSKKMGTVELSVCALGNSIGTGAEGVSANVVEVKNFEDLKRMGEKNLKGKIVFFNRPMDPTKVQTFEAYGGAVDQRGSGASEAAKYGAIGVIVRSMGINPEDYPHTGSLRYAPNITKIPAIAVSTKHADLLSNLLKNDSGLQLYFETHCMTFPDAPSFNVVGQINGSEYKDEIIAVGGHLDSWDLAQGAHDDGTGCIQSIEALRIFKTMGYKPKRTLRAVMFMNEENGLRGGTEYAIQAKARSEKHIAAIESDRGGFVPRGFVMMGKEAEKNRVRGWKNLFEPYGLTDFGQEGSGADISPLGPDGTLLMELLPDSQRYFSYHHTPEDTFDKVDKRELELGAASMAAMIYLIDMHGLK